MAINFGDSEKGMCGPSTMKLNVGKAGMQNVDTAKVNEIIINASKGSKYYMRQQERQRELEQKIKTMNDQLNKITPDELMAAEEKMDQLACELEKSRDLSRVIVHIDMDAYYAAVEMRDDPQLTGVPMAVGGMGMLSTSNYLARKFGVRAAMPGFIAKKLCPELVIVTPNFKKYSEVADRIRQVIAEYDPNFCPMSLDEAYLEITGLVDRQFESKSCKTREQISQEIVDEIRQKIFHSTNLTCSAGIAVNSRLAKVGSNVNKPNGQCCIPFSTTDVIKFISTLPIGKICGIGNVSEQLLNSLDVKVCKDFWDKRSVISILFSPISCETYLSIALGLGSTKLYNEDCRKSRSVERTFRDTGNVTELKRKCKKLSILLSEDLKHESILGKVVTLKLKTTCYHVKTRAQTLAFYTNNHAPISTAAVQLLEHEIKSVQPQSLVLRLMGVRMSSLIDKSRLPKQQQQTLEDVFKMKKRKTDSSSDSDTGGDDNDDFQELCCLEEDENSDTLTISNNVAQIPWMCPVCNRVYTDDEPLAQNQHIDECLTKQKIREVLRDENEFPSSHCAVKRQKLATNKSDNKQKKKISKTLDDYFKNK